MATQALPQSVSPAAQTDAHTPIEQTVPVPHPRPHAPQLRGSVAVATHPPLETLQSNIYYHLGLAHYLLGQFDAARRAYVECRRVSLNPDNICSVTHWLYMTLRRMGREDEAREAVAQITADMAVIEYHAYHKLCLAYAGKLDIDAYYGELERAGADSVDFATAGYGIGNWHLYNGDRERARAIFNAVARGAQWHAFGHIAAENELALAK